jgi:hypothetical protein
MNQILKWIIDLRIKQFWKWSIMNFKIKIIKGINNYDFKLNDRILCYGVKYSGKCNK